MRTDRFFACSDCRVRVYPVTRCPMCGDSSGLADLSRGGKLSERPMTRDLGVGALTALGGAAMLAVLGKFISEDNPGAAEAFVFAIIACLLAALVLEVRRRRALPRAEFEARLEILAGPVARRDTQRTTLEGRVVAGSHALSAPLSGAECVAFRLLGAGPGGPLDDAQGTTFDLKLADGERVRVHAERATLELHQFGGEDMRLAPDAKLARWLRARGHDNRKGEVICREALLRAGDLVQITARMEFERESRSYRGNEARGVLRDEPGSPLHIRPAGDAPRAVAADAAADPSEAEG